MNAVAMAAQDRKWKAESDFHSLVDAEQVRGDKKRHRQAKSAGRRMVRDETKALGLKRRISGRSQRTRRSR